MWVVVLLLVAAVLLDLYGNAPMPGRRRAVRPTVDPPAIADSRAHAEAALVSNLLTGALAQADYRLAMERLAARDAGRHSVVAPDRDR